MQDMKISRRMSRGMKKKKEKRGKYVVGEVRWSSRDRSGHTQESFRREGISFVFR